VGVSIGPDTKTIETYKALGVDFFSCGDDISFLQQGARQTISMVRK
jgi:2-dehydro-3-deoxyglucarate aldolase/4-hydroxy-2-oxoheptanedioate aldolase